MFYKIEVRRVKAQPIIAVRRRTDPEHVMDTLRHIYGAIGAFLGKKGIEGAGPPFTRYHSREAGELDVEGGLFVKEAIDGEGDISVGKLPGGLAAVTVHTGDYAGLPAAHEAVRAWIERNGKQPEGGSWEVYLTDPSQESEPSEWKTEVFCVMQR